jgi:hypothetical protein
MTIPTFWFMVALPVGLSLVLSQSKAGAICLVAMLGWRALVHLRFRYLIAGAFVVSLAILTTPILSAIEAYWFIYQHFDEIAAYQKDNSNLVMGRAAATAVVPAIVMAHPLLGVGMGNYSLVRADPQLGVQAMDEWDLPGIGLFSYVGDLGIPLFLYLIWIVSLPLRIIKREQFPELILLIASYQLFAQMIEVQVTFFYPWAVSAITLGYYLHARGPVEFGATSA